MTGDLEDMVIPGVMDDLISPQGRYPERFMFISLLEVCQKLWVKKGAPGTRKMLRVPS